MFNKLIVIAMALFISSSSSFAMHGDFRVTLNPNNGGGGFIPPSEEEQLRRLALERDRQLRANGNAANAQRNHSEQARNIRSAINDIERAMERPEPKKELDFGEYRRRAREKIAREEEDQKRAERDEIERQLPFRLQSPDGDFKNQLIELGGELVRANPSTDVGRQSKEYGLISIQESDESFTLGDSEGAHFWKELGKELLDIAIGLNPTTGLAQSFYELGAGRSIVTGDDIGPFGRTVAFLGVVTGGGSKTIISVGKLGKLISKAAGRIAHLAHDVGAAEHAIHGAIKNGEKILDSAGHVPGGAKNIFHYHSLKQTLKEAELSSIFEKSGIIKSELAKDSIKIISGTELRNPQVIAELTKDGSALADWGKYTYNIRTSSGTYEVHYYFNQKLGTVNPSIDYKILLPGGGGR
jgi:hypothetical protein